MAEDRSMNFQHGGVFPQSFCNQQVVSFQSGAVNSATGMIGTNNMSGISSTAGMILANNPAVMINNASLMIPPSNSPSNILLEPVPGLKHGIGLAVDWSYEELAELREGLDRYANEPNIMKYIKIAARLPDKTVRDVAMRCRWMTKENGKRRKQEEYYAGKKIKDGKEKMVDCSTRAYVHPIQPDNAAAYSLMTHHVNHNNQFSCEAPVIDGATRHLLAENVQLFNRIAANLATFQYFLLQIQNNIKLFCRTRNNITTIIKSMSEMPGIMSQMPPLPVSINEDLFSSSIPSSASQAHAPGSGHLKEEPKSW
ncbi:uncharacterized protein LOC103721923 isoform X2 [Phoenix dactylifera]|uniref:Uncharacterized protein LOC103721923 isoform X2 n=1 Tax=Phoenix dactylifera TaxID=42345 RepID=A0A8B8JCI1_PHODC|nr:uncharacterized protein LOC103721923 isoform X2 [Phoenix dactylifera]